MSVLVWDAVGSRNFEIGVDRGVLYLSDGSAVPWNGLTSVVESSDKESTPVYYDGMKINDLISPGDFSATMTAFTYPDEFLEFEGLASPKNGVFYGDQKPKAFCLSYRTQIGNDLVGDSAGYKIHILYNVTAIPSDKTYATQSDSPTVGSFEWHITAVPEEVPGFRPTAHFIINTIDIDPLLLSQLETMLYGDDTEDASLMSLAELVDLIANWSLVEITDNGDGTWTASTDQDDLIEMLTADLFQISEANVTYLNVDTYNISSA